MSNYITWCINDSCSKKCKRYLELWCENKDLFLKQYKEDRYKNFDSNKISMAIFNDEECNEYYKHFGLTNKYIKKSNFNDPNRYLSRAIFNEEECKKK